MLGSSGGPHWEGGCRVVIEGGEEGMEEAVGTSEGRVPQSEGTFQA